MRIGKRKSCDEFAVPNTFGIGQHDGGAANQTYIIHQFPYLYLPPTDGLSLLDQNDDDGCRLSLSSSCLSPTISQGVAWDWLLADQHPLALSSDRLFFMGLSKLC